MVSKAVALEMFKQSRSRVLDKLYTKEQLLESVSKNNDILIRQGKHSLQINPVWNKAKIIKSIVDKETSKF